MANPRQRRKTRSSSYKPVSQSKRAKRNLKKTPPIRGPRALQQAWDKHKTVRQNYTALGLIHDLNPTESGGVEISIDAMGNRNSSSASTGVSGEEMRDPSSSNPFSVSDTSTAASFRSRTGASNASAGSSSDTSKNVSIPAGYGKIIRDENGNIVDVQLAEEPEEESSFASGGDVDMEQLSPELDESIREKWTDLGGNIRALGGTESTAVVKDLEKLSTLKGTSGLTLSASITGVGARHASKGEVGYLERLVSKYGNDLEKMARDRKLNSEQRTAGELRRALGRAGMLG